MLILTLTFVIIITIETSLLIPLLKRRWRTRPTQYLKKMKRRGRRRKVLYDINMVETGEEFEDLCCGMLDLCGFKDVSATPVTGDYGLDIICKKKDIKYGIQCKYYTGTVGVSGIQEAFTGAAFYECDVPVLMTNSTCTQNAKYLAEMIGVEIWDKAVLTEMIDIGYKEGNRRIRKGLM